MKIDALEKHGIPKEVIRRWTASGMRFLLPIQAASVNRFGILDGKSVVISGPGTSGKTFCGEMAALRQAASGQRAIFLVPLKAIAEEKYRLFRERYSPLGIKVALATRDHVNRHISDGKFDILISIYEKFNSLTASDITLIRSAGCFVLDEFQMISNVERGQELELLVAKIRAFNPQSQLIVLMGEGASPGGISGWLKIPCLEENRRPVDLRLGVLHRGTFHFRGFNDFREGEELWLERRDIDNDSPLNDQVLSAVEMLINKGEQVIVFCSTKKGCVNIAAHLAESLGLPRAGKSIEAMSDLAPSIQNEHLGSCLCGGVAFHHAELDADQRRLVEDGFRGGEIRALVSTTTLAWGVNLPAKNVFIEMMKYEGTKSSNSRAIQVPISVTDFHQAAGRAGRLGSEDSFGRAVMTASTPYEREVLWERYVYSRDSDNESRLDDRCLVDIVMKLAACGAAVSVETMNTAIERLYCINEDAKERNIASIAGSALVYLAREGFLKIEDSGKIYVTQSGQVISASGLTVETAARVSSAIEEEKIKDPLEWLFFIFGLREWIEGAGYYSDQRICGEELFRRLFALADGLMERSDYLGSKIRLYKLPMVARSFKEFLFALEWISGTSTRDLEMFFDRGGGGLKRDADTLSWILNGIEKLLRCSRPEWCGTTADGLLHLSTRFKYGVTAAMLPVAMAADIDREFVRRLFDFGIKSPNDLFQIDYQTFKEILPRSVIEKIRNKSGKLAIVENPAINQTMNSDPIVFTGATRKGLKEIIISGTPLYLQPKLHSYMQRLWWGLNSDNPWVFKESLEPGLNQAKYISKLRKVFRQANVDLKIISDGAGSYRLILPEGEEAAAIRPDNEHIGVNGG